MKDLRTTKEILEWFTCKHVNYLIDLCENDINFGAFDEAWTGKLIDKLRDIRELQFSVAVCGE